MKRLRDNNQRGEKGGLVLMKYVDGFVIPVAKENLPAYREMAKMGGEV